MPFIGVVLSLHSAQKQCCGKKGHINMGLSSFFPLQTGIQRGERTRDTLNDVYLTASHVVWCHFRNTYRKLFLWSKNREGALSSVWYANPYPAIALMCKLGFLFLSFSVHLLIHVSISNLNSLILFLSINQFRTALNT